MSRELFGIKGRVALVTGASRGIGRAIALGLAGQGVDVAVHYCGNAALAEEVAGLAREMGVRACIVGGDLSSTSAPRAIFEQTMAALGRIDILVLNASVQIRKAWDQIPLEEAQQQVQVNFIASLQLMQLAVPEMVKRRWGRVVTVGSVQQTKPHTHMMVYAATKSAQLNMVRNLAAQVAGQGVTVNNLAPGVIDTDRNAEALSNPEYRQKVLARIPSGTVGEPNDCVGAALLLCSEAGRYITGEDLVVDGGFTL